MSQTISFLNRKGGTGKTTTAVNVALALLESGKSVSLIVTDRNYTAESLTETMKDSHTYTALRQLSVAQVMRSHRDEILGLRRYHERQNQPRDFYIIDGAPNLPGEVYRDLASVSDAVILPTNCNGMETVPTEMTLHDIAPAHPPRVALLATRIHPRTALETVIMQLEPLHVPVIPFYIPHYKAFGTVPCDTGAVFREAATHILRVLVSEEKYAFDAARYVSDNTKRNKILHIHNCEYAKCGKQFTSSRKHARFCSDSHRMLQSRIDELQRLQTNGNLVQVVKNELAQNQPLH